MRVRRILTGLTTALTLLVVAVAFTVVPSIAAGGLLHPARVALYRTAWMR
jgi:hypothetical protein